MKAMVLAAGLGTRLRPLTDRVPKPLVPVCNRPLVLRLLETLKSQGISSVVMNVHHLADEIMREIGDGSRVGVPVTFSYEPQLLGTGGGIAEVRGLLEDEPAFLVINADVLIDINLEAVIADHQRCKAAATVVVQAHPGDSATGWLGVDSDGWVRRVPDMRDPGGLRRVLFSGIHVLSARIFDYLAAGQSTCILRAGYVGLLRDGLGVRAFEVPPGAFTEVGRPDQLIDANFRLLRSCAVTQSTSGVGTQAAVKSPVMIGDDVAIGHGVQLGPYVVIGDKAKIGEGAQLEYSVVLPGSRVKPRVHLREAIVFAGGIITMETRLPAEIDRGYEGEPPFG